MLGRQKHSIHFALILIVAGVALILYAGRGKGELRISLAGTSTVYWWQGPNPHGSNINLPRRWVVTLAASSVDAPERIRLREGFLVRVKFRVTSARFPSRDGRGLDSAALQKIEWELRQRLRARLAVAGMEVEPKGFGPVGGDLSTSWSVRAVEDGEIFIGVVQVALEESQSRDEAREASRVLLPGDVPLKFKIDRPRLPLSKYVSSTTSILGILATSTGLIVFGWQWRDRRRQQEKEKAKGGEVKKSAAPSRK